MERVWRSNFLSFTSIEKFFFLDSRSRLIGNYRDIVHSRRTPHEHRLLLARECRKCRRIEPVLLCLAFLDCRCPPTIITRIALNIDTSSATLGATVNPHGQSTTVTFEYGPT